MNSIRDELHLLRAKQAPPSMEFTKQPTKPKLKAAKKKGLLQTSPSSTSSDTLVSCA